jgi:enoyl-CoA hydratase/carnithine racemase
MAAAAVPQATTGDITVSLDDDFVATVEIHRPPNNFFDLVLIRDIANAYEILAAETTARAIVLCSEGKHFCAGANFGSTESDDSEAEDDVIQAGPDKLYAEGGRMLAAPLPVVAAVQGAAIGGGLGLACSSDFRVAAPEARLASNFARLGFHQGFGLSVTLPAIVGNQAALDLLYTGRRIGGEQALTIGLVDQIVPLDEVRIAAHARAAEIAESAPLAIRSIRQTMRAKLLADFAEVTQREAAEQIKLRSSADFVEGVKATADRRPPVFTGK